MCETGYIEISERPFLVLRLDKFFCCRLRWEELSWMWFVTTSFEAKMSMLGRSASSEKQAGGKRNLTITLRERYTPGYKQIGPADLRSS
jgi:hypothetical protein